MLFLGNMKHENSTNTLYKDLPNSYNDKNNVCIKKKTMQCITTSSQYAYNFKLYTGEACLVKLTVNRQKQQIGKYNVYKNITLLIILLSVSMR